MKTAVSIPNALFQTAEVLAQQMGLSRSELYAKALKIFVGKYHRKNITEKLNEVYAVQPSGLEEPLLRMQVLSLPREEW